MADPLPTPAAITAESLPPAGQHDQVSESEILTELIAKALALYSQKSYDEAADLYAQAAELQDQINGEMDVRNADLLFAYGRCLFYVAQKTSDVLGGQAAGAKLGVQKEEKPKIKPKKRKADGTIKSTKPEQSTAATDELAAETAEKVEDSAVKNESGTQKPLFSFSGDQAFEDSDDEDSEDVADADNESAEEEAEEEPEDDFATSFEILDTARLLYARQLTDLQSLSSPDPTSDTSPKTLTIKTRLSDIYDLQSEISLENESYSAAATDLRSRLDIIKDLYSPSHPFIAECHYKLSLALEMSSQTQQRDQAGNPVGAVQLDWTVRNEAITEQEAAIKSTDLRIEEMSKKIKKSENTDESEKKKLIDDLEDLKDMQSAMVQRLEELRKPPVDVKAEVEKDGVKDQVGSAVSSLLNGAGGKAELAQLLAGANDLSGMVKRKKPRPTESTQASTQPQTQTNGQMKANGKRKLDDFEAEEKGHSQELKPQAKNLPANDTHENGHLAENGRRHSQEVKRVRIEDIIDDGT